MTKLQMCILQEKNYVPFDFEKEEPMFSIQRKVLPNNM